MINPNSKPMTRCLSCGGYAYDAVVAEDVSIRHEGKAYSLHIGDLRVYECEKCGEVYYSNRTDDQIQNALRAELGLLLPEQIVALREARELTQADVCRDTGIAVETLSRWENGRVIQSKSHDMTLRAYLADPEAFRRAVRTAVETLVELAAAAVKAIAEYAPAPRPMPMYQSRSNEPAVPARSDGLYGLAA